MSTSAHDLEREAPAAARAVIGEKYEVSRLLGAGGMGAVYEAENTWTRRRVAVKVMRPEFTGDPESAHRFLREAQTAARIEHPHVVSVLDMGRDAATGSLFIVQEYLVGRDLRALLDERRALPVEQALELMLPVLDGLVAAHALGVVHRDLKPENIFLVEGRGGRASPKIIDFGIAKALRPGEHEFRTMISQAMGTPGYMSPEQARGDLDLDARTDVWSAGVVLYELLTGRMPYEDDGNPQVMLARVLTTEPAALDEVAPWLPAELRAVIGRALRRDRTQRYPDMAAFYDALSATASGAQARASIRVASAETTPPPSPVEVPVVPPSRARWAWAAAAAAVVLATLAAWSLSQGRAPDAPSPAPVTRVHAPPAPPQPVAAPPVAAPPQPAPTLPAPTQPAPPQPVAASPQLAPAQVTQPTEPTPHGAHRGHHRAHGSSQRGSNGAAILD